MSRPHQTAAAMLLGTLAVASLGACASAPRPVIVAADGQGKVVPVDSLTTSWVSGGVRVILRPAPSNDVVAANLYLLGGSRQLTARTAGIEYLLLTASEFGTRRYPGDEARRALARTGAEIVVDPGPDWTVVGLRALAADIDSAWAVFADRVAAPELDSTAVELARGRLLARARRVRESPDLLVGFLADSAAFAGHPYGIPAAGTERSLAALQGDDLRRYLREQMVTSRMLLVVVGNVTRHELDSLVSATLGRLPAGDYRWTMPPAPPRLDTTHPVIVERHSPTNYVYAQFPGPPATSEDYAAFEVAVALLGSKLHHSIREERSLSYAAMAPFDDRAIAVGGAYASTARPAEVVPLMRRALGEMQSERFDDVGIHGYVRHFITDYYLANETNAAQAEAIARATLFGGDPRATTRERAAIEHVSAGDVYRVARTYMRNVQFVFVGDTGTAR
ncbi:MAG TPA: pitrilysin family protein [Gemmatimonadaceae bacterium]